MKDIIMNEYDEIRQLVRDSTNVVFFGGAGVSTESGIPDFRGSGGLYTENEDDCIPPEVKLSHNYLMRHTEAFYRYYRGHMLYPDAKPNDAHYALAQMEKDGILTSVITQNIDGLHSLAGSSCVYELHGSVLRNYCLSCGKKYNLDFIESSYGVPRCSCGGIVRPDVVMYGEGLDMQIFSLAEEAVANADILIVGGTSLTVNPAASLVSCYEGSHLIIINKTPTPYDDYAEYVLRDSVGVVLSYISQI